MNQGSPEISQVFTSETKECFSGGSFAQIKALSSYKGMNLHLCWWHGSQAQALKGALWASLPLWKASGTNCIFGASTT